MVTASHNPPQDNGYKVYLGDALGGPVGAGAQIVPPADAGDRGGDPGGRAAARRCRWARPARCSATTIVESYVDSAAAVRRPGRPARSGGGVHAAARGRRRGARRRVRRGPASPGRAVVAEQAEPDPDVPDRGLPQPGGAGRDGPGCSRWPRATGADIVIANDPDADRCAVAIPAGDGGWRMLRGDEVGVLLADHLMRRGITGHATPPRSCRRRCCARCARARGVPLRARR